MVVAWLGLRLKAESRQSQEMPAKSEVLPPGVRQIVQVSYDHVIERWRDGPTKIKYRDRYLPPEGHVEVITKKDQANAEPQVEIKDRGFTFRPGGGMIFSEKLMLEADAKLAYWNRYSLLVGINSEFGGLGACRHVDDFTPFRNLEFFGLAGLSWRGELRLGIGVRSNF
jgi:hypothetical protein